MAYSNNASPLGTYNVHSCNVLYSRAKRDHTDLENGYQLWLAQREKKRRGFNTQLDRQNAILASLDGADQSPSSLKKRKAAEAQIAKNQAELDKMDQEDNETADPEILKRYPHSITAQRPAYRRLAYQLAAERSEARIKKAEEARDLALAQQAVDKALEGHSINDQPASGSGAPAEQVHEEEGEERPKAEASDHEAQEEQPAAAAAAPPPARQSTQTGFASGKKVDSFLARLNGPPGSMTRKVGLTRPVPQEASSTKWTSKWGLHDVRASKFQHTPKTG
ncbi:hypothetical protein DFH28DRAFT_446034 [Melampsora americana]|nr:hypothetical protein DFH28DRAFT_446034 [Melampsora americana]